MRVLVAAQVLLAVARVEELEGLDLLDEGAVLGLVLAVDIAGDAAPDGDRRGAGLGGEVEAPAFEDAEELAERDARLDGDEVVVDREDAVEGGVIDGGGARGEARGGVGEARSAGDAGAVEVGEEVAVAVGAALGGFEADAAVEGDEAAGALGDGGMVGRGGQVGLRALKVQEVTGWKPIPPSLGGM